MGLGLAVGLFTREFFLCQEYFWKVHFYIGTYLKVFWLQKYWLTSEWKPAIEQPIIGYLTTFQQNVNSNSNWNKHEAPNNSFNSKNFNLTELDNATTAFCGAAYSRINIVS